MNSKQIERYLRENGFTPKRPVRHGTMWTDGRTHLLVGRKYSRVDQHAIRNLLTDVQRAIKKRGPQESPVNPEEESKVNTYDAKQLNEMQRKENQAKYDANSAKRSEPLRASLGTLLAISKATAESSKPAEESKKTDPAKSKITRRRFTDGERVLLITRIRDLMKAGSNTASIFQTLRDEGVTMSNGDPIDYRWIRSHVKNFGPVDAPAPKAPTPAPAPVAKTANELPDAVTWILLDQKLTETQKVAMVKAWAGI